VSWWKTKHELRLVGGAFDGETVHQRAFSVMEALFYYVVGLFVY
jgi:hypothetical protein